MSKLEEIAFFEEMRVQIANLNPFAVRYCEKQKTPLPLSELKADECCNCPHYIANEGFCDLL